jgi:uncharacterized protein YjdB
MKRLSAALLCLILLLTFPPAARAEGTDAPAVITDAPGMLAIAQHPEGSYVLGADIDMSGVNWVPIPFSGSFDGAEYTLCNLRITQPCAETRITYDGRHRGYHTVFAALFSGVSGSVKNLNLLNETIDITTDQPCFIAGIAGMLLGGSIEHCSVAGRMKIVSTAGQCGAGGIAGFGKGLISGCNTDAEITIVAVNPAAYCEEYLGGVLANGFADVEDCVVKLAGYTSVRGYVHNGGVVGLSDVNPENKRYFGYVRGCSVDAAISFYEDVADRRAYCRAIVGEIQNDDLVVSGNETEFFDSIESKDFSRPLLPDSDANPVYDAVVTPPGDNVFGYSTYTNPKTGYSYTDHYTLPAHTPVWQTVVPATYDSEGLKQQVCAECGTLLAEEPVLKLVASASCTLNEQNIRLNERETYRLSATILPADAADKSLVWSSSDESVVRVDENGLVAAVGEGQAVVSCKTRDGFASDTCMVEVYRTFGQWIARYILFGWIWE